MAHSTFWSSKAGQIIPVCESGIRFVVAKFLVALHLRAHDLVREEVGCIDGVFFGVAWSVLEDEIK